MPTYQYACTACGEQSEVVQKFTDDPLTVCTVCGGRLRKVFSPVGIVFKGTGFYRTDSRAAAKETVGAKSKSNGSDAGAKPSADSGSSGDSKAAGNGSSGSSSGGASAAKSDGGTSGGSSDAGKSSAKVA